MKLYADGNLVNPDFGTSSDRITQVICRRLRDTVFVLTATTSYTFAVNAFFRFRYGLRAVNASIEDNALHAITDSFVLLYGERFAKAAIYEREPIYVGIWDFDDLDGSSKTMDELCRLVTSGNTCGVYYDLGACICSLRNNVFFPFLIPAGVFEEVRFNSFSTRHGLRGPKQARN